MNGNLYAEILHKLIYFSDILFSGIKIMIPLLFVLSFINFKSNEGIKKNLIVTSNNLLLLGGMLFAVVFISDMYISLHAEDKTGWNFMLEILSGPHWYQYVLPVINFALLPQIMWINKCRKSVFISFLIVFAWWITYIITFNIAKSEYQGFKQTVSFFKNNLKEYSELFLVFTPVFLVVYYLLSLFDKRKKLNSRNSQIEN